MGGVKGYPGVRDHKELYQHVHGRTEVIKADILGVCGQIILSEAGQL